MRLAIVLLAILVFPVHAAPEDDPFRVAAKPPTGAVATTSADPVPEDIRDTPMLSELAGILGSLGTRDFVALRRATGRRLGPDQLVDATPLAILHMARGDLSERLEILALPDGRSAVRSIVRAGHPAWLVGTSALRGSGIAFWRGNTTRADATPGARVSLEGTADPAGITLDTKTTRRIFRANYPDLTRDLAEETIRIRLPRPFDPRKPAGILVWISPAPDGRIPPMFEPVLDELGFIAVGADNAGNQRALSDRLQLMLDAIESARRRYHIDESRIYVTGMSGGGRCSTILQCCMPDVFAGAVPIVGMDTYHLAPTGRGNMRWPARIGRPPPKVFRQLKERRIHAITGDMDFNEPEMSVRTRLMKSDGLNVTLDVIPGMAHTMPAPEHFAEALRWVDEPQRAAAADNQVRARSLLDSIPRDADPAEVRADLIRVIATAPWSEPAWEAAERLGFERP